MLLKTFVLEFIWFKVRFGQKVDTRKFNRLRDPAFVCFLNAIPW